MIEKTKHHILDTLAAMVSGTELPPGKVAQAMAKAHTGEKTATVVGTNISLRTHRSRHGQRHAGALR